MTLDDIACAMVYTDGKCKVRRVDVDGVSVSIFVVPGGKYAAAVYACESREEDAAMAEIQRRVAAKKAKTTRKVA